MGFDNAIRPRMSTIRAFTPSISSLDNLFSSAFAFISFLKDTANLSVG